MEIRPVEETSGPTRTAAARLAIVLALAGACGSPPERQPPTGSGHLVEVGRVELQEIAGDPIVGIGYVGRRPGGGFLVADERAGHVRLFDRAGRQVRVVGEPGRGPGELEGPTGAVELPDGRIFVVQRAGSRLTSFPPDSSPRTATIPGYYGFWAERLPDGFVAGVATRDTRFAVFDGDGNALGTFGSLDPTVVRTPFWIFFAADHAAVRGRSIAVNTSLFPTIRLYDFQGDSVGSFSVRPDRWEPVSEPPVSDLSAPGNRDRVADWSRTFTVVRQIAPIDDSLLVVQYGRHDPREADPYFVAPTTANVYSLNGDVLAAGVTLPGPVVGGGSTLLVLVAEPPDPWTLSVMAWRRE